MALGDPIPGVSDGELIRTTWGDAVADEINNSVKKTGTQSMSGVLSVSNDIYTNNVVINNAPTGAAHATRKDYVDTKLAGTGGTLTGNLRMTGTSPAIEFYNVAVTTLYGFIQSNGSAMTVRSDATYMTFSTNAAERMRLAGSTLLVGKNAINIAAEGHELRGDGQFWTTIAGAGVPNMIANHAGAGNADSGNYISFRINNTVAGHISQGTGTNCIFNAGSGGTHVATSDYRFKDDLGPIVDPVGRLMQLQPKHLRWKENSGTSGEFDGFLAHQVTPVEASAVTGEKDAVYPQDHPDDPGGINPQGLDEKRLVPLLTAALQDAHTQIAALTARLDALEAAA